MTAALAALGIAATAFAVLALWRRDHAKQRSEIDARAQDATDLLAALGKAEADLLRERLKGRTIAALNDCRGATLIEMRHQLTLAKADRDLARSALTVAEVQRDLLLEASRCLPDLRGENVWESTGDAPLFIEALAVSA